MNKQIEESIWEVSENVKDEKLSSYEREKEEAKERLTPLLSEEALKHFRDYQDARGDSATQFAHIVAEVAFQAGFEAGAGKLFALLEKS